MKERLKQSKERKKERLKWIVERKKERKKERRID